MANRIKQLREREGMNQAQLADFLHTSQGSISNWEQGRHDPDNDTLIILSQKFNVSIDYLLGKSSEIGTVYNAQNINNSQLVQGNGNVIKENENSLSVDENELVRIFRLLDAKQRHKLMSFAFGMEERTIKGESDNI